MYIATIRGSSKGLLFLSSILACITISFSLFALYVFISDQVPETLRIPMIVFILFFFFVPGVMYLIMSVYSYFKKVCIYEDRIEFVRPFRKTRTITMSELSIWGCAAYVARSTIIFFCTTSQTDLLNYLDSHWKLCQRIFGSERIKQRKTDKDGVMQLAVGTYLFRCMFYSRSDVFILDYGTVPRVKMIANILQRDALVTGPGLIDRASLWGGGDGLREP